MRRGSSPGRGGTKASGGHGGGGCGSRDTMTEQPCLFCGGDRRAPDHDARCDGRQGAVEAAAVEGLTFEPLLIAGADPATYDTSAAAAESVEDTKDTQRAAVRAAIQAAGRSGRTDDEIQVLLHLDGSSERPRRWELWKRGAIDILRDGEGRAVRRLTRTNRWAVVWVTVEARAVEAA